MSIFAKFNDQGLGCAHAFEEMCCQLFETWGKTEMGFGREWRYCNIRGAGGDSGIEAYWCNSSTKTWIGLQAKWFCDTLTKAQYAQIAASIDTALKRRPSMKRYIVCLPHKLTSTKRVKNDGVSVGEDAHWSDFELRMLQKYPDLQLDLWDEHRLLVLLEAPENAGSWRFWFDRTAINPQSFEQGLSAAVRRLNSRYIPSIVDSNGISDFLDDFFGTYESRKKMIGEIDTCLNLLRNTRIATESLVEAKYRLPSEFEDLKEVAENSIKALSAYCDALALRRQMVADAPDELIDTRVFSVDYAAIESLQWKLWDLKQCGCLHGHVNTLIKLIEQLKNMPSEWGMVQIMKTAFGSSHCLVIGDPGTGKTCGLVSKACNYHGENIHIPILIMAADVEGHDCWRDIIVKTLGLDGSWDGVSLWRALNSFAATRDIRRDGIAVHARVAVLIDGLDEAPSASKWADRIREADAITEKYPRIKFVYSSRPNGIEFPGYDGLKECIYYVDDQGDVITSELFDRYINYYDIDINGCANYRWMLHTPMELRLFCDVNKGKKLTGDIETNLTALIEAYMVSLESEYAERYDRLASVRVQPLRKALIRLAEYYLETDETIDGDRLINLFDTLKTGADSVKIISFLVCHGILVEQSLLSEKPLQPKRWSYRAGSRPLWDYFMAVILEERGNGLSGLLRNHSNAALMYGIMLIEKKGLLPIDCDELVERLGENKAQSLSMDALVFCSQEKAKKFRSRVLDKMAIGQQDLFDVVNGIVAAVARVKDHPLGPLLLDDYLRAFDSPIERDTLWSIPRRFDSNSRFALYGERNLAKDLPKLYETDLWNQMPLLLAWCLSSVSNLKRSHCRNELVKWGMCNPREFTELFSRFCDCDDPQIREDMFAIAEEIVCQGVASIEVETELGEMVLTSVFGEPDKAGNRDAAIRFYGRLLVERCFADCALNKKALGASRPPYRCAVPDDGLRVFADACSAKRMSGYGSIGYDLARYVLVDKLEQAFGIRRHCVDAQSCASAVDEIIQQSAAQAGISDVDFEGWAIAAAYQYLLDHGYRPEVFEGYVGERGCRSGGLDWRISRTFDHATHGSRSTVMTVAEKYVWCARNEICGYLADRVSIPSSEWSEQPWRTEDGMVSDYGALLGFDSPLFEATVTDLIRDRSDLLPVFPAPFSCGNDDALCSNVELTNWIEDANVDSATVLFGYVPDGICHSIEGDTLALALYASDWGQGGKETRVWAYCGVANTKYLTCLQRNSVVSLDGYSNASSFTVGIERSGSVCYVSPVELFSAPWVSEYDEPRNAEKLADVHIDALPFVGSGVASLTDIGDYHYYFPSALASRLMGVIRTDGARYYDRDGDVVFEDVRCGKPFRQEYQALIASKDIALSAVSKEDKALVWYVTLHRGANILADERHPDHISETEISWLVWHDGDGGFRCCVMSDVYSEVNFETDPSEVIKNLIERYESKKESDDAV